MFERLGVYYNTNIFSLSGLTDSRNNIVKRYLQQIRVMKEMILSCSGENMTI